MFSKMRRYLLPSVDSEMLHFWICLFLTTETNVILIQPDSQNIFSFFKKGKAQ